jgi:primosomal protein N'
MVEQELEVRRATGFPPYAHLARCVVSSGVEKAAREFSQEVASSVATSHVEVIGPGARPISLLRNTVYRWHLLCGPRAGGLSMQPSTPSGQVPCPGGVGLAVDVDPYSMM